MGNGDDENVSAAWYPRCIRVIARGVCRNDLALGQSHIALRADRNDEVLAACKGLLA